MKKKIAIVCSGHVPSQFAHSINTVKHANAFFELGYNVELLTVQRFYEKKNLKKINIFSFYGIKKLKIKFFKDQSIFYYQDIPFFFIHAKH